MTQDQRAPAPIQEAAEAVHLIRRQRVGGVDEHEDIDLVIRLTVRRKPECLDIVGLLQRPAKRVVRRARLSLRLLRGRRLIEAHGRPILARHAANQRRQAVLQVGGLAHEGNRLRFVCVLNCDAQVSLAYSQLGLAHDVELHGRDPQRPRIVRRSGITGGILHHDAEHTIPGVAVIPHQVVEIALQHCHLRGQLFRHEEFEGHDVVEVAHEIAGRRRQRVRPTRGEIQPAANVASKEVDDHQPHHHENSFLVAQPERNEVLAVHVAITIKIGVARRQHTTA